MGPYSHHVPAHSMLPSFLSNHSCETFLEPRASLVQRRSPRPFPPSHCRRRDLGAGTPSPTTKRTQREPNAYGLRISRAIPMSTAPMQRSAHELKSFAPRAARTRPSWSSSSSQSHPVAPTSDARRGTFTGASRRISARRHRGVDDLPGLASKRNLRIRPGVIVHERPVP